MKDKKIIGLTGTYCAGKNHVALLLEKRGLPVLDVDKLGYKVIETEKNRILARFGEDILGEDGFINRKRLGVKVFGRPGELAALEEIIHPGANRETLSWINGRKETVCVINAALLHRSSVFEELDAIIIVEAPFLVRLFRARKRDHLPWGALLKRFRSQKKFNSQYFREKTDIYRVSNPSGCIYFGCFRFREDSLQNKLEKRIDEILSLRGIK
jgi:dephospho-CoA kinase